MPDLFPFPKSLMKSTRKGFKISIQSCFYLLPTPAGILRLISVTVDFSIEMLSTPSPQSLDSLPTYHPTKNFLEGLPWRALQNLPEIAPVSFRRELLVSEPPFFLRPPLNHFHTL